VPEVVSRARPWLALAASAVVAAASCAPRFEVDGARAHARVVRQVEAGPRVPGTAGHGEIREWIAAEIERLGGRLERQDFTDTTTGRPLALTNLIGRFGPGGGRRIALLAHWDSRPVSDRDPDPARRAEPLPGANDGGSGVAVLLEVAELMHRRPPPVGVDLVFVDGEDQAVEAAPEQYCLGSREYARRLRPSRDAVPPVAAAFVFDMVGDADLAIHPEVQSARRSANLVDLVLRAARETGARGFRSDPKWNVYDDHVPLLEAGIPAVDVIDFDYPAWHTTSDRPDQVSPASLSEVAAVAAWIVYRSPLARP
jgi:Zn-dependent M28 family amino/carboxypeptidase